MKNIVLHHTGTYATAEANIEYFKEHIEKNEKLLYKPNYFIDMNGETFSSEIQNDSETINIDFIGLFDDELTHAQKDSFKLLFNLLKEDNDDIDIKFDERCMHNYLSDSKQQELISYITN